MSFGKGAAQLSLRFRHIHAAKYMILQTIDELTCPDFQPRIFVVANFVLAGRHGEIEPPVG